MTARQPRELWYCEPWAAPGDRKCRSVPCHGHLASGDQLLVAKVIAWLEGQDWNDVYRSELRDRLRRAWRVLQAIKRGAPPEADA